MTSPVMPDSFFLWLRKGADEEDSSSVRRIPVLLLNLLCKDLPNLTNSTKDKSEFIRAVLENISLKDIIEYVSMSSLTEIALRAMWETKTPEVEILGERFFISVKKRRLPKKLYKYMHANEAYISEILKESKLYFPSPHQFNDPFDCGLSDEHQMKFAGHGMLSLSQVSNHTLMWSHYADSHKGICLEIETESLVKELSSDDSSPVKGTIRPVWYLDKKPEIDIKRMPAHCATIKHRSWSYEKEYRVFPTHEHKLLKNCHYRFPVEAITKITLGCNTDLNLIAKIKSMKNHDVSLSKCVKPKDSFFLDEIDISL